MKTKMFVLTLGVLGFCMTANAAPKLNCRAADKNEVVEALELSKDGKEIVQIAPTALLVTKLIIENVQVKGADTVISGKSVMSEEVACAGSCPETTFQLNASSREIFPNSVMIMTTSGFDEKKGKVVTTVRKTAYACDVSGFKSTPPQVIAFNTVRIDGKTITLAKGETTIDKAAKKITVKVTTGLCPRGATCVAAPRTNTYEVAIQNQNSDGCAKYTNGQLDKRPVDGGLITVQVEDNTENTCEVGGMVESIYKTTVEIENSGRGGSSRKVIELVNKKTR